MKRRILITGAAGFIGFHLCHKLIKKNEFVIGLDNMNSYYDPKLKKSRINELSKLKDNNQKNFSLIEGDLAQNKIIIETFEKYKPNIVIHLAAQAGVRYSITNPDAYLKSNLIGFMNIIESCRRTKVNNFIYASSSSVYGGNTKTPFREIDSVDHPVSLYAATKRSNELIAHSYSHLYNLPSIGLRFFTVYGPWGRPDMALFKFTKGIINKKKIDIYNKGKMYRDFTYIDDIVNGITSLINKPPNSNQLGKFRNDSLSPIAPFRILNIGNTKKVFLLDFIDELEKQLGKKAIRNYMSMQKGDVKITVSNTSLLKKITKYNPKTHYKIGIKKFLEWYLFYYKIKK